MKYTLFTLLLIGSSAFATKSELRCTYNFPQINMDATKSETLIIMPNTTYVVVSYGNVSTTFAHNADFSVQNYVNHLIENKQITDGLFFAIRRDDTANVLVKAMTGDILGGRISNVSNENWDFGATDESTIFTGSKSLGNLRCTRSLN